MKLNIEGSPEEVAKFLRSLHPHDTTSQPDIPAISLVPERQQQAPDKDAVVSFVEERAKVKSAVGRVVRGDGTAMCELIVEFLRSSPQSSARDIRTALGETDSKMITARLAELTRDEQVTKIARDGKHAVYELNHSVPKKAKKAKAVVPSPSKAIDPKHADYLMIMGVIVKQFPDTTYFDIERGARDVLSRTRLADRLLELERMKLVTREGGRRAGPVMFHAHAPSVENEYPLAFDTTEDAIHVALLEHKALTAEQISIVTLRKTDIVETITTMEEQIAIVKRGERYSLPKVEAATAN